MAVNESRVLGTPMRTLDQLQRLFSSQMRSDAASHYDSKHNTFATLGGTGEQSEDNTYHRCPCRERSDPGHKWKAAECRMLIAAANSQSYGKTPTDQLARIRTRLSLLEFASLKKQVTTASAR